MYPRETLKILDSLNISEGRPREDRLQEPRSGDRREAGEVGGAAPTAGAAHPPPNVARDRLVCLQTRPSRAMNIFWGDSMKLLQLFAAIAVALIALPASAADYPAPKEGSWVVRDFRFHTGEVLPELRLHYSTVGAPTGEPVLILHGTSGLGREHAHARLRRRTLRPRAAARREPLLHHPARRARPGKSTKPSDGLRAKFPKYNYDDMVEAQYRLRDRAPGRQAPAPGHRQLDGRHADLDLGREVSGLHGRRWCRWPPCRPRCRAATGCCAA